MPAEALLEGIAKRPGWADTMLERLVNLLDKSVMNKNEASQVVNVLAKDMRDFTLNLRQKLEPTPPLKG
jgi:hypothetical protein